MRPERPGRAGPDRALLVAAIGATVMAAGLGTLLVAGLVAWGGGSCTYLPPDFICGSGFMVLVAAATVGFAGCLAAVLFLLAGRVRRKRAEYIAARRAAL